MSHEDSLDDEVKAILAKADTDDSLESNNPKKDVQEQPKVKDNEKKNDSYNDYDIHEEDDVKDDSQW